MHRLAAVLGALLALGAVAGVAHAHTVTADEVVARLDGAAMRTAFDVVSAQRLDGLPRLLIVRVGPGWRDVPAEKRRAVAEEWAKAWQHAVAQGVLSIVDAANGATVVNFDALGRAHLDR